MFDIVYFTNFESPFCTISLKNITFIFTAYFQKFFECWKKIIHLFLSNQPQNFCHRVHYEPHLKLHFLTPLLFSLAVLKSTLLPKRPLKAIRTLLFSWRLLLLHDTYLRGRRKKKRRSRVVLSSHFFSFWRFSCRK